MSKVIPTAYDVPGRLQYTARSTVDAADWVDLIEGANYLFARSGARFGGAEYETALALPSDGSTVSISTRTPASVCSRYVEGDLAEIELKGYGSVAQIDAIVVNAATNTAILTLTASTTSATAEEFGTTDTVAKADTLDGSGDPALLYAILTAETATASTAGELYAASVREPVTTDTSLLPTGL